MSTVPASIEQLPPRRMVADDVETRIPLAPGDLVLVEAGAVVEPGDALVDRLLDPRVDEAPVPTEDGAPAPAAGSRRVTGRATGGRRRGRDPEGELLMPIPASRDGWRIVVGDHRETITAPTGGTVVSIQAGGEVRLRARGRFLRGAFAAGTPARGRLQLAVDPFGELRPDGIDVGRAGSILVVGSRIDAEALTRARAMGVRGIVVASLAGKEQRDFVASERRQQAAFHPAPPFGVLVLDGALRRPIASPVAALLERLAGREVAILTDPPGLVFDDPEVELPEIPADWVRVRHGPSLGAEGRFIGLVGLRRFAAGVHLEAARVAIEGEPPVDLPLADLERLA